MTQEEANRALAEGARLPTLCRRKVCRRSGACAGEGAPCFWEFLPLLNEFHLPQIRNFALASVGRPPLPLSTRSLDERMDDVMHQMLFTWPHSPHRVKPE